MVDPLSPAASDGHPTPAAEPGHEPPVAVEVGDATRTAIGATEVRRLLPRRTRRTVGPWCFLDHFGPADPGVVDIGPHPHCGLQTVTWLLDGELVHRDTLGSEQPIRPGQLNLMTAGRGIAHAEELAAPGRSQGHGVQLWVAQPESTRHGAAAFEHHGELPTADLAGVGATVLAGTVAGITAPTRIDSPQVGFQLTVPRAVAVPLDARFEHAVIPLDGPITIDGRPLALDQIAYLAPGRAEATVDTTDPSHRTGRVLVVGGAPWDVRISMWWNFVGRNHDELTAAYRDWQRDDERFGTVASELARIPAPAPPWSITGT